MLVTSWVDTVDLGFPTNSTQCWSRIRTTLYERVGENFHGRYQILGRFIQLRIKCTDGRCYVIALNREDDEALVETRIEFETQDRKAF
ncbi:hypothetical protein HanHA300_Chr09g0314501 [Helianthus annuus]|nr:hypothetical protein HanHA300_Chr09g0314501 [Helianthus annuus]KAJ0542034.1 hypothetical protein HanHA89_Chr09g0335371 [Helianthus annuus]KAJ0707098.1 hypothetical protein HanLR1_Chr09g0314711 [Helianthus annuus]KAJ0711117.1 hypothetical protein HanOQP8_Chr09g0320271 [Helianthus annuus]